VLTLADVLDIVGWRGRAESVVKPTVIGLASSMKHVNTTIQNNYAAIGYVGAEECMFLVREGRRSADKGRHVARAHSHRTRKWPNRRR
jgi:hypothetical protein